MATSATRPRISSPRRSRLLPVALAASALAVGALGTGAASAGGSTHTLRFTATGIEDQIVNGVDIQSDRDTQNGRTTGYDVTSCVIDFRSHLATCDVSVARADGMIYAVATTNVNTGKGSGTVTGGTRAFRGVRGTVSTSPGPRPNSASVTLTYHR